MLFHTDYGLGEWWQPGEKFLVTSTAYLNDDYEGGEIVFFCNDELFTYKPKAGDVLVFPSGNPLFPGKEPFFHGVRKTLSGRKILVRTYLKYFDSCNFHLWHSCKKIYGEEKWLEMTREFAKGKNALFWADIEEYLDDKSIDLLTPITKYLYQR